MRYETKTFGDLQVGDHFWSFGEDCGENVLEKIKTAPGESEWADRTVHGRQFYPTDHEVWVPVFSGWPTYLTVICVMIITLLAVAFGWWIVDYFKGL